MTRGEETETGLTMSDSSVVDAYLGTVDSCLQTLVAIADLPEKRNENFAGMSVTHGARPAANLVENPVFSNRRHDKLRHLLPVRPALDPAAQTRHVAGERERTAGAAATRPGERGGHF